ncbi:carboxymuconolactone decarboxylase family protein [Mycolicibacterium mengxianglii]|uniref:carboxymuconolactone decarboxylase family protein n=1 Tax=Mycolicibacterium mengxianglii TaxID=2736649 RepID=UPI0038CC1A7D
MDEKLVALAELRVTQLVGCAYCCAYHAGELRQMGFDQSVIDKSLVGATPRRLMPSSCSSWSGQRR